MQPPSASCAACSSPVCLSQSVPDFGSHSSLEHVSSMVVHLRQSRLAAYLTSQSSGTWGLPDEFFSPTQIASEIYPASVEPISPLCSAEPSRGNRGRQIGRL